MGYKLTFRQALDMIEDGRDLQIIGSGDLHEMFEQGPHIWIRLYELDLTSYMDGHTPPALTVFGDYLVEDMFMVGFECLITLARQKEDMEVSDSDLINLDTMSLEGGVKFKFMVLVNKEV